MRKAKPCERCEPPRASFRGGCGKPREVSVTSLYRAAQAIGAKGESVPYLRLSGRWLERLGFATGCRVVVTEERGKLTLAIARDDCSGVAYEGQSRSNKCSRMAKKPSRII